MLPIRRTLGSLLPKDTFLIKEGKAYTEDGFLIFNLYVIIHTKMTKKEVHDCFTYFGEVKTVHLLFSKPLKTLGFVHFVDASSAAKALQDFEAYRKNDLIYIAVADSWGQPNGRKPCIPNAGFNSANSSCSADSKCLDILLLSDYSLEKICHKLELSGQINFARTCPRFHSVFHMYSKRAYRSFNYQLMMDLTKFEASYFFRYVGEYIETLSIHMNCIPRTVQKFIGVFCVNVKRLSLHSIWFRGCYNTLLRKMKDLKELNVRIFILHDADIEALTKIPSLEIIILTKHYNISGAFIKNMPQLIGLILNQCKQVQISHLIEILQSLTRLKLLDVRDTINATNGPQLLDAILNDGKQLEVLKMDCFARISYESLAQLPNLRRLELNFDNEELAGAHCKQILESLVIYKSKQLESLAIRFHGTINILDKETFELISQLKELKMLTFVTYPTANDDALRKFCNLRKLQQIEIENFDITNQGVLALLYNCQYLCHINIRNCRKVDTIFISEAIKLLKSRKDALKKPVVFRVSQTSIDKYALSGMPDYKAAVKASLIKVVFYVYPEHPDFTNDLDKI